MSSCHLSGQSCGLPRQHIVQDYEMPKDVVPPGEQTGVYYIPISNLPFNVSWQQIKDYVRQVCEVDHVEVFQKSTSGWIRVKGRENFDAAFAHLDGKEFNGRSILADGRNGECPTLVRDLELCKPTGSTNNRNNRPVSGDGSTASAGSTDQDTSMYATGGPVSYSGSPMFSTPTSTTTSSSFSHQVGPSSHHTSSSHSSTSEARRPLEYQCVVSMPATHELMMPRCYAHQQDGYMNNSMATAACSSNFMSSPDITFSQGLVGGYDSTAVGGGFTHPTAYEYGSLQAVQPQASFMAAAYPVASDAMYNAPTPYAVQPPVSYSDYYPPTSNITAITTQMSNMAIGPGATGSVIYTEQRGVHIRDISRRASEDQIHKMIREVTGPEAALIETVKVPLQDGAPRGHAFVHFRSASVARRLVEHLNGTEFKGRNLQVRLMKEGDAIGGACSTTTTTSTTATASSSRQHSSGGKHHHSSQSGGTRRRSERKDRDRPEKSSASSKPAPLVVSGGGGTTTSVTSASATATKDKHGKKASPVIIADGSSARRTSDVG